MDLPALDGVVETCLYVTDVKASRDFYVQTFGFAPLGGDDRIQPVAVRPGQVLILFRRGGTPNPVPVGKGFIPPHDGSGAQHVAFGVPARDFDVWKNRLEALDISVESVVDWPQGGYSLYFRDPDGLLVELITPGVWTNY